VNSFGITTFLMTRSVALSAAAGIVLLLFGTSPASAQTDWINSSGGDYSTVANWDNGVPSSSVDADFQIGNATYAVSLSTASAAQNLHVSNGDTVTLNTAGYTLATSTVGVSDSSALTIDGGGVVTDNDSQIEASALTVEGAGTQLTLNSATITYNGQDTANTSLQILDGGQVKSANQNGFVEFGPAYLTITVDGAGSVLESTGTEEPSDSGLDFFNETTNITNGGLVSSATGLDIGFDGSGVVLNVTGPGSKITAVDELVVGQGGDGLDVSSLGGTLNITRGATAGTTDVNSGITVIGGIEGNGAATVDGAGSELFGVTAVGDGFPGGVGGTASDDLEPPAGQGVLNVTNGGKVDDLLYVGYAGTAGVVNVDGIGSVVDDTSSLGLQIGNADSAPYTVTKGTMNVTDGGVVNVDTATFVGFEGGQGYLNVGKADGTDTGGSTFNTPFLGITSTDPEAGDMLDPHGEVNLYDGGTIKTTNTELLAGPDTELNVYGGTLNASNMLEVVADGASPYPKIKLAGGTIAAKNISLLSTSVLTWNSGTIKLTGGTLSVSDASILTVPNAGLLTGTGTIEPATVVGNGAVLAPGYQIAGTTGIMHFTSNLTLAAGSTLKLDLGGLTAGTQYDQITGNNLFLIAGNLQLNLVNGFAPKVGDLFYILDNESFLPAFGTFANGESYDGSASDTYFTDDAGDTYLINYLATDPQDNSDYSVSLQVVAVPEPTSVALLLLGVAALFGFWRRTTRSLPAPSR
jgi:fibronectin-binding autotransporter adhesin